MPLQTVNSIPFLAILFTLFAVEPVRSSDDIQNGQFEISGGSAIFTSPTNVPGVEVKGKSTALSGRAEVSREGASLVIQNVEATVPAKTFATGMKVRDEHLRKYIFTTREGSEPDLRFDSKGGVCTGQAGRDYTCTLEGSLSIRGTSRPFQMTLSMKDTSGAMQTLRAAGDGTVKLSAYGIDRPTQFGVQSSDEVKLHLEFTGKQKATIAQR